MFHHISIDGQLHLTKALLQLHVFNMQHIISFLSIICGIQIEYVWWKSYSVESNLCCASCTLFINPSWNSFQLIQIHWQVIYTRNAGKRQCVISSELASNISNKTWRSLALDPIWVFPLGYKDALISYMEDVHVKRASEALAYSL